MEDEGARPATCQEEIYHRDYNLDRRDNLDEIPEEAAVFGVFGIIHGKPVHCRYVGESENLRAAVRNLFERPGDEGLAKFMQGPWIQMLVYGLISGEDDRKRAVDAWKKIHDPRCDENGEYAESSHRE